MQLSFRTLACRVCAISIISLTALSCSQYEYNSPDPGVVDVRLAVKNSRTDLIPFPDSTGLPFNGMFFVMKSLEGMAPSEVRLPIFSDLNAIRRNPDGDEYNALSAEARDSVTSLGSAYAPPGSMLGLEMVISPPEGVFISYGFYGSFIPVNAVFPFTGLQRMETEIPVTSGRVTRVTVTFDLDQSLLQLTESFLFVPVFYISSVEIL